MANIVGSNDFGGINQDDNNEFVGDKFWFQWIEFPNRPTNLTEAGFNTADGSIFSSTTVYNAGGTDDLDGLATTASARQLGDDVVGDASQFGIRVSTVLSVQNEGTYRFDVRSDDGMILYVNGQPVVSDDSLHPPRTRSGEIELGEGDHEIVIIYFERTGRNVLEVDVQSDEDGDYPTEVRLQDANVQANRGDDSIVGLDGDDTLDGGDGDDFIDGGGDNDQLTGGDGNDVFVVSSGSDRITDFGAGNTGSVDDDDQSNNDFVDLSGFYNAASVAAVNDADADPNNDFSSALHLLHADAADGVIDGIVGGIDYSAEIGGIDLTIENGGAAVGAGALTTDTTGVMCFAGNTRIASMQGLMPVMDLSVGDYVMTLDHGYQPIRWIGCKTLDAADLARNPKLRPIRIKAGALAEGVPEQDLVVSPQHRVLVRSAVSERMFGVRSVLIAANKLLPLDGVDVAMDISQVDYYHIMFDDHQVVFANGAPAESLYPGTEMMRMLSPDSLQEVLTLFPELGKPGHAPKPAQPIPALKQQKKLVERHIKNARALLSGV